MEREEAERRGRLKRICACRVTKSSGLEMKEVEKSMGIRKKRDIGYSLPQAYENMNTWRIWVQSHGSISSPSHKHAQNGSGKPHRTERHEQGKKYTGRSLAEAPFQECVRPQEEQLSTQYPRGEPLCQCERLASGHPKFGKQP